MSYEVFVERSAAKGLARISPPHRERIAQAVLALAADPRPPGVKKLTGREAWRIRVGAYRVIYEIDDASHKVLVSVIGPRQDIYRH